MTPTELIMQILANFVVASLVFYFLSDKVKDLKADKANLEAENQRLRLQHDADMERLMRRRAGDTGKIPELPVSEVAKYKRSIGE